MLTPYRRHKRSWPHRNEGRAYRDCRCPIWVDGVFYKDGVFLGLDQPQSLHEHRWSAAEDAIEDLKEKLKEKLKPPSERKAEPKPLAPAWDEYANDLKQQGLTEATLRKSKYLRKEMEGFAASQGLRFIHEFDLKRLTNWRATWTNRNYGALKKLESVSSFLQFAQAREWIKENPARPPRRGGSLKRPKVGDM